LLSINSAEGPPESGRGSPARYSSEVLLNGETGAFVV
jgi:hypothetical protein